MSRVLLLFVATTLFAGTASATPVEWTVASGGNGHFYDFLGNQLNGNPNTYSWDEARLDAEARGGYLATPTSAAEWAFMQANMFDWVGPVDPVYNTCGACGNRSYQGWLGGFQNTSSPSYSEPAGGWEWVTGEPWSFTAWSGGEPNNSGGENHMMTWFHDASGWNDHVPTTVRYFIEYDTNPVPEPTTGLLLGLGLLGVAIRRRRESGALSPRTRKLRIRLGATFASVSMLALCFSSTQALAVPVQWTVASGGNGHWYEGVGYMGVPLTPGPYDWPDQRANAEARGGYLATITSEAENRFISTALGIGALGGCTCVWLGGFQNPESPLYSEPGGGWEWVTGEPWVYTHWYGGEPNNSGAGQAENYLTTWFSSDPTNVTWNDHYPNGSGAYLIEWDSNPIPEPTTGLLLGLGLLGVAVRRRV